MILFRAFGEFEVLLAAVPRKGMSMDRREALRRMTFGATGTLLCGKPTKELGQLKVTEVTVSAARSFNHPYEMYSNFKPMLSIKAAVIEGEDVPEKICALQQNAERIIENHKQRILDEIDNYYKSQIGTDEMPF